jgi:hypothetical protein
LLIKHFASHAPIAPSFLLLLLHHFREAKAKQCCPPHPKALFHCRFHVDQHFHFAQQKRSFATPFG